MFTKAIDNMIKEACLEVKNSKNKDIQKALKIFNKELNDVDTQQFLEAVVHSYIARLLHEPFSEEESEENFVQYITDSVKDLQFMKKTIVLDVKLKGLEMIHRTIEIPYVCTLADLAYAVLVAFQAEGSHLFSITYNNIQYYCDTDEEVETYASQIMTEDLNTKKGSKLELWYDFGDNYIFDITVKEVKETDTLPQERSFQILDGSEYGIWEDAHHELYLYYTDKKAFKEFVNENELDDDFFPIHETFDRDEMNELFYPFIQRMKMSYEYPEEYDRIMKEVLA